MSGFADFPETDWARLSSTAGSPSPVSWFCDTYRSPVEQYLRTRYPHHEAQDLCQEFFLRVVLPGKLLHRADPARGSLRALLHTALERFLSNQRRRGRASKRGGRVIHQSLDDREGEYRAEPAVAAADEAPDRVFDRVWARYLLDRALEATRVDCEKKQKSALFAALCPLLDGSGPARSHQEIATELQIGTREVTLALFRLRQRVARHLYEEVSACVSNTTLVAEEMQAVREALRQ